MTLPQALSLFVYWRHQPPLVTLVSRVCRYFSIDVSTAEAPVRKPPTTLEESLQQMCEAGLNITPGRPDDPMLDLLDIK